MSGIEAESELLSELAHQFSEQLRRGEQPTVDQYANAHPELSGEIRELFPALLLMEQVDPAAATPRSSRVDLADDSDVPSQLGEYRILRRIGHGGMGIVYEAVQESLGRHVALKLLPVRRARDGRIEERFKREAQAAAQLHHTNIVPVFGVGEVRWVPQYYGDATDQRATCSTGCSSRDDEPGPGRRGAWGATHSSRTPRTCCNRRRSAIARRELRESKVADALASTRTQRRGLHRDIKPVNCCSTVYGMNWSPTFGLPEESTVSVT